MPLAPGGGARAGNVQMHPVGIPRKLPQQHRGGYAPRLPSARVLHIRHIRFNQLPVLLQHRQFPKAFPAALPGPDDALRQRRRVAHHPGAGLAQGNHHRPGQRSNIHQPRDAQRARVAKRIRQDKPPLRIGIDDLNRFAVHRRHHIAGALRPSARHILGSRHQPGHIDARAQAANRAHRRNHRGAPGHIPLHRLHIGGRFQRYAPRVKGYPLAHQPQIVARVLRIAPIGEDNQLGRFGAALRHPQQRAHTIVGHPLPFQNVHLQIDGARNLPRGLRQPGGRHNVGGMIDQIPRQNGSLRQRCAGTDAGPDGLHRLGAAFYNGHGGNGAGGRLIGIGAAITAITAGAAAISVKAVETQQRPLGNRLPRLGGVQPAHPGAVSNSRKLRHPLAPQKPRRLPADPAHRGPVKTAGRPQPGHQHPPRRQTPHSVQQRHLPRLAPDFPIRDETGDRPVQGPVHRAGAAAGVRYPLKQVHHQRRGSKVGNVAGNNFDDGGHSAISCEGRGAARGHRSAASPHPHAGRRRGRGT